MSVIGIITDFGTKDYFVSATKGSILSINPEAKIVDITHQIPEHDIEKGAFVLSNAVVTFPKNSTFLAIINPGTETELSCIAVKTENCLNFVGPDNGILSLVAEKYGVQEIREIKNEKVMRENVSNTFPGRDVMAPAAAHLSKGAKISEMGPKMEEMKKLGFGAARIEDDKILGRILNIDNFGNLVTNIKKNDIMKLINYEKTLEVEIGEKKFDVPFRKTFADAKKGENVSYIGDTGLLEIAKNQGNIARKLGLKNTDKLNIKIKF